MFRERLTWLRVFHLGSDVVALVGALVAIAFLRGQVGAWWPFDVVPGQQILQKVAVSDQLSLTWMLVPAWLVVLGWRGRYRRLPLGADSARWMSLLWSSLLAMLAFVGLVFLLRVDTVSRTVVTGFALGAIPALWLSQRLALSVARRFGQSLRLRIIGPAADAGPLLQALAAHSEWGVEVIGREDAPGPGVADDVDEVVVVGALPSADLAALAASCEEVGVPLSVQANFLGTRIARATIRDLDGTALLTFTTTPTRSAEMAVKRGLDVVGAGLGLLFFAPLFALLAVCVRLDDGGPVFYVQQRVGRYGRRFRMLKLRTMGVGADAQRAALASRSDVEGPAFKMDNDPRITRVGRFLRRSSLDELPQLVHVLRGEMSLVGPRPPLPEEVDQYARWQRRRLSMRPGLTGLWQVTARDEPDVARWIALDLQYIDQWSLAGDLQLLLRTVPAVLSGRGAR
ncbi:MAG: exopolysaccharide biosynthesis polyprenyl glycosylphosphotransferase [Myxococcota bacterium]|jgi:exopolysaccharide biosynthesis polyprenyl glycosylphosphotransferase